MKPKAAAIIIVKTLALFSFIKFITYLQIIGTIIDVMKNPPDYGVGSTVVMLIVPIILLLAVSLVLWLYAEEISGLMVKNIDISEEVEISDTHLQTVAFSVVGLCLVVVAIPELVNGLLRLMIDDSAPIHQLKLRIVLLTGPSLHVLIGLWLLLGARGVSGAINKLQNMGLKNGE